MPRATKPYTIPIDRLTVRLSYLGSTVADRAGDMVH